jgi:PAS domain S-box-containing protein
VIRTASPTDSPLLAALFAETPVGLAFWDTELRYQRVNDVLARMSGLTVDEHLGRAVGELLPQLGPRLEELLGEVVATGKPQRDVYIAGETPAAPGVTRHWSISCFPVRDEEGAVAGIGATVVESTGEIDAQLRAVHSALPVGVAFITPDMRYEHVNEALARVNGRTVDEHLGRTVREVLGEHGADAERLTREVIARGQPMELELGLRTPASPDEERFYEATYFPVYGSDHGLLGVGSVVRDVTDRHVLEQDREGLLRDALTARAQAQAAQIRAEAAREEAEAAREEAEAERGVALAARRRASFLATVTRRMAASMDYEATLREVVSSAVPYIADWCLISVVEPGGRLRPLAFAHSDPEREQLTAEFARGYKPGRGSSATSVLKTGEPELIADVTPARLAAIAQTSEQAGLLERLGIRHFGTWPIPSPQGEVIGALSLILGDSGRRFSDDDLVLAQTVATRAGLHITNARLYTERSQIAQTLQASLLPRELPEIPGIELASVFLPAGDQNMVGGDFFDVFKSGDGVWSAILGDVSGKGAKAAAITAAARHTLRAAALIDPQPAANLALLNRVLIADLAVPEFCTIVYARLCPGRDKLTARLANGGHPAALVLRDSGIVEEVSAGRGPLVGIVPDAEFQDTELELGPGDLLLLYTDGVTEVRTSDIALGERELVSTLAAQRGRSAHDVAEAIKRSALGLQGGVARDDIAVLAIRVPGAQAASASRRDS